MEPTATRVCAGAGAGPGAGAGGETKTRASKQVHYAVYSRCALYTKPRLALPSGSYITLSNCAMCGRRCFWRLHTGRRIGGERDAVIVVVPQG